MSAAILLRLTIMNFPYVLMRFRTTTGSHRCLAAAAMVACVEWIYRGSVRPPPHESRLPCPAAIFVRHSRSFRKEMANLCGRVVITDSANIVKRGESHPGPFALSTY